LDAQKGKVEAMVILVCGNINAGKSTTIERLKKVLPYYEVISVDDFRRRRIRNSTKRWTRRLSVFTRSLAAAR
jgi:dephospho-CoA kinase